MKYLNSRISYSITLYVLIMILVFTIKPKFIFNDDGSLKSYGVNDNNKTIYSLGVISVCAAILAFYFFCIVDIIFK
jgi:hypothetical protein